MIGIFDSGIFDVHILDTNLELVLSDEVGVTYSTLRDETNSGYLTLYETTGENNNNLTLKDETP